MMTKDAQRLFVATVEDIWGMYLEVSALHTKIPATASTQHLWILSNIGTKCGFSLSKIVKLKHHLLSIHLLLPQRIILIFERVKSGEMLIKKSEGLALANSKIFLATDCRFTLSPKGVVLLSIFCVRFS